ncbi:MAG: hypothetical protein JSS98_07620 [Bacteroidetes bacterium]|nr:hypothetical protein [Bacteroidota bacterium]
MKKILIAVLLTAGTFGFANAQTKKKEHKPATTAQAPVAAKAQPAAPVAAKVQPAPAKEVSKKVTKSAVTAKTSAESGEHLKKDGTPDKRFKDNKAATHHLKKDGTPDMRYKENKK